MEIRLRETPGAKYKLEEYGELSKTFLQVKIQKLSTWTHKQPSEAHFVREKATGRFSRENKYLLEIEEFAAASWAEEIMRYHDNVDRLEDFWYAEFKYDSGDR